MNILLECLSIKAYIICCLKCLGTFLSTIKLDLRPGFCIRKTSEFQIKVTGPNIWNTISEKTRLSISLTSFKKRFKK